MFVFAFAGATQGCPCALDCPFEIGAGAQRYFVKYCRRAVVPAFVSTISSSVSVLRIFWRFLLAAFCPRFSFSVCFELGIDDPYFCLNLFDISWFENAWRRFVEFVRKLLIHILRKRCPTSAYLLVDPLCNRGQNACHINVWR